MNLIKILLISVAFITASGCTATSSEPIAEQRLTYVSPGDNLMLTTVTDINGNVVALNDTQNNKLVILFATWCHDSQRFIKQLTASPLINDPSITIVGFGREETPQSLREFATKFNVNFSLVADSDRSIYDQFANTGIPRIILVDHNNKIVKTIIGEQPNAIKHVVW